MSNLIGSEIPIRFHFICIGNYPMKLFFLPERDCFPLGYYKVRCLVWRVRYVKANSHKLHKQRYKTIKGSI